MNNSTFERVDFCAILASPAALLLFYLFLNKSLRVGSGSPFRGASDNV
ncbi:hypothetical protein XBJ1_1491 [Xenorhabdus bovienii SS-2004]|uniref:Uncharacterized protein n=1 Tax=Xenorhabdus bovienii (strain SS-2004) TaxID=406818 RepID=D3V067_XENBS|nr:hypothetical protein XBJ1_1491 [Xenorhabdus bovienii SS-2004]